MDTSPTSLRSIFGNALDHPAGPCEPPISPRRAATTHFAPGLRTSSAPTKVRRNSSPIPPLTLGLRCTSLASRSWTKPPPNMRVAGSAPTSCSRRSARAAWARLHGRAGEARPPPRGAEGHQGRHGHRRRSSRGSRPSARRWRSWTTRNIARVLDAGATDTGPSVLRDGAGQGRPDHRVLRPAPAHAQGAARAFHPRLPGDPARRIRRGSSIATSSPRTSWSRSSTAGPCPR